MDDTQDIPDVVNPDETEIFLPEGTELFEVQDDDHVFDVVGQAMAFGVEERAGDWVAVDVGSRILWVHEPSVHGDDKSKSYGPYTAADTAAFIAKIRGAGFSLTGGASGPWTIDPGQAGIKLSATQAADGSVMVSVTDKAFYVPYSAIWSKVDAVMPPASAVPSSTVSQATQTATQAKQAASKAASPQPLSVMQGTRWDDLSHVLMDFDTLMSGVHGEYAGVHFFPPMTSGQLLDMLDDMNDGGWTCSTNDRHTVATCTIRPQQAKGNTIFRIVIDEEMTRAQLLQADDASAAWASLESWIGHRGATVHGDDDVDGALPDWAPPASTDPAAHVAYLQKVYDHASASLADVQQLAGDKKQQAAGKLQEVLDKAVALAHDVKQGVTDKAAGISQDIQDHASKLEGELGDLYDRVTNVTGKVGKSIITTFLEWMTANLAVTAVAGVVAYKLFVAKK